MFQWMDGNSPKDAENVIMCRKITYLVAKK